MTTPGEFLNVTMSLARLPKQSRGLTRGHRLVKQPCFERYAIQRLNAKGTQYELLIPNSTHRSRKSGS